MPPNIQESEESNCFINQFWSTNKSGMDALFTYISGTHEDLKAIENIYSERSQIEKEYGEKLISLAVKYERDASPVYEAVTTELSKTGSSRIEFAEKLSIGNDIEKKVGEYKELIEKWTSTLEEIFNEKRMRIVELLKIRARYLKEHEMSKGQSTTMSEALKSQYKVLVTDVDEIAQEWNTTWQEACEVMEAMEEDRIEFIKGNVWEYANLGSSSLFVPDKWCENIRMKIEAYSTNEEIEKCISLYATGSRMPTTNEYVNEIRNEQKRKNSVPKPPSKSQTQQLPSSSNISRENSASSETSRRGMKSEQEKPKKNDDTARSSNEEQTSKTSTTIQLSNTKVNISSNGGSTAARAPIKRKPLDKALMEKVTNEMAVARKQRDAERQSYESDDSKSIPSDTYCQPTEYKPDSGSIPIRRGNTSHMVKESTHFMNTHTDLHHEQLTHPIAAPKSPRPPPQQIPNDMQHSQIQRGYEHDESNYIGPFQMQQATQLQCAPTVNHQKSPMMQPQRSPMIQPQRSPMIQPQRSPMIQPQRSPMIQPQRSPMIQPQRSPMMQPQRSPMMPPQAPPMMAPPVSPMMQPLHSSALSSTYLPPQHYQQNGTIPPPIAIPQHNYNVTPQPSPNMSYASPYFGPVSPAIPQQPVPKPTHYSDGRPILFWVFAKYDYEACDSEELSFSAHATIGITEGDMTQEAWWSGAVFDEYHQTWSNIGSVPSNFTELSRNYYY